MAFNNNIQYEFSYEKRQEEIYIPKATVIFKSFTSENSKICEGIVDTGSEVTLVASELIKELEYPSLGTEIMNTAVIGESINIIPCWGLISFYADNVATKHQCIKLHSCKRQNLAQDVLLGMNFINKYEITFSGKEKKFYAKLE